MNSIYKYSNKYSNKIQGGDVQITSKELANMLNEFTPGNKDKIRKYMPVNANQTIKNMIKNIKGIYKSLKSKVSGSPPGNVKNNSKKLVNKLNIH